MCGEIFSPTIRSNIIARKKDLDAVVDLGHESDGFRVHAGMKFCYDPGGVRKSTRNADTDIDADVAIGNNPRVELKIWRV